MTTRGQRLTDLFAAAPLQRPEDSLGFLLWRAAHRHQRDIDRAVAELDLTHLQFVTLVMAAWLGRSEEAVTQPRLAAYSRIHPMQLSSVLKKLEHKGLVARPRTRADVRIKQVELTVTGIEVLTRALPLASAAQRRFLGSGELGERLQATLREIVASFDDD